MYTLITKFKSHHGPVEILIKLKAIIKTHNLKIIMYFPTVAERFQEETMNLIQCRKFIAA